jgi:hypothetical protein
MGGWAIHAGTFDTGINGAVVSSVTEPELHRGETAVGEDSEVVLCTER